MGKKLKQESMPWSCILMFLVVHDGWMPSLEKIRTI
ncbi:hypothetical protein GLYMA_13G091150v4 [Glycine max]|nr:hypothetical protein GYH30_035610 [Glycine max]KRH18831.2 hypothetical protein GLYMA_13G091150v4 [Glycine max]